MQIQRLSQTMTAEKAKINSSNKSSKKTKIKPEETQILTVTIKA